jgi:hypothetical protein
MKANELTEGLEHLEEGPFDFLTKQGRANMAARGQTSANASKLIGGFEQAVQRAGGDLKRGVNSEFLRKWLTNLNYGVASDERIVPKGTMDRRAAQQAITRAVQADSAGSVEDWLHVTGGPEDEHPRGTGAGADGTGAGADGTGAGAASTGGTNQYGATTAQATPGAAPRQDPPMSSMRKTATGSMGGGQSYSAAAPEPAAAPTAAPAATPTYVQDAAATIMSHLDPKDVPALIDALSKYAKERSAR